MKRFIKYTALFITAVFFFMSCEKDDYKGDSKLTATNPTITISGIDANGYNFIEKDSLFAFTVTLSEPQIVDVQLTVKQIAGDATVSEDYTIENTGSEVVIPAYSTTGTLIIKIKTDDLVEDVETFTLQIGDQATANTNLTPVTAIFTIGNSTKSLLEVEMSWTTDIATVIGIAADPDEAVDLAMLIIDNSDQSPVATIDGASFESFDAFSELPDGEYAIAVNVFSSIDAGDLDEVFNIDVNLVFNQGGVINDLTLNYPKILESVAVSCNDYRTVLAIVTKSGTSYTIAKEVTKYPNIDDIKVAWTGLDTEFEYPSEVTTYEACSETFISGLNNGWMFDFWGEVIIESAYVSYTVDTEGNIDIPLQYYMSTTYNGAPQVAYNIVGDGTIDSSGVYPIMTINYDLVQGGTSIGTWMNSNPTPTEPYMSTPYFVATLTLDPSGLPVTETKLLMKKSLINKPVR